MEAKLKKKPHQIRRMRRLIEDYKTNSALLCNVHQPGNNDSLPEKKREASKH